jgi:hypothetical protein
MGKSVQSCMRLVARMMLEAAEEYGDEYVATGRDGKEARLIIEEDIGARPLSIEQPYPGWFSIWLRRWKPSCQYPLRRRRQRVKVDL